MKKITILALHLSTGGVEKSIATLSNILVKKYDVEIISNYQIEKEPAFTIDKRVKITYLMPNLKPNRKEFREAIKKHHFMQGIKEGIKAIKILYLRRALMVKAIKNMKSDIAISTRYIHSRLLGKYGASHMIKIAQEHNNNGNEKYVKKVVKSLKNIDFLLPVSSTLTKMYQEKLAGKKTKCIYIPHCLKDNTEEVSSLTQKNAVSIGRLSVEKGYLDLIDVFEIVLRKNSDWHLNIAGDGTEREKLETKIQEKNLQGRITLLGFQNEEEIHKLLLQSSIYVMTSLYECFPLVLIEAQSHGIPLVAFDSAEGAKEIIQNGENGFLIRNRNQEQMADKINKLIEKEELRKKMGQVAKEKSKPYQMENVEKLWYKFIEEEVFANNF